MYNIHNSLVFSELKDGGGYEFSIIIETIETCYCVQMWSCGSDYDILGLWILVVSFFYRLQCLQRASPLLRCPYLSL